MTGSARRRARRIAIAAGAIAVLALTGCSAGAQPPTGYGQDWVSRMSTRLADGPRGQGGGGGQLTADDDDSRAEASIVLEGVAPGEWDILAVCRSTATVRLDVHLFRHDRIGKDLGTVDVACGATSRLPITVPDGQGVVLDASSSDVSGRALWNAVIVRRGWEA